MNHIEARDAMFNILTAAALANFAAPSDRVGFIADYLAWLTEPTRDFTQESYFAGVVAIGVALTLERMTPGCLDAHPRWRAFFKDVRPMTRAAMERTT